MVGLLKQWGWNTVTCALDILLKREKRRGYIKEWRDEQSGNLCVFVSIYTHLSEREKENKNEKSAADSSRASTDAGQAYALVGDESVADDEHSRPVILIAAFEVAVGAGKRIRDLDGASFAIACEWGYGGRNPAIKDTLCLRQAQRGTKYIQRLVIVHTLYNSIVCSQITASIHIYPIQNQRNQPNKKEEKGKKKKKKKKIAWSYSPVWTIRELFPSGMHGMAVYSSYCLMKERPTKEIHFKTKKRALK